MKKILILMGRYLPGHKDGGPLRTMFNVTDALGDEYDFHIACLDRDHGDTQPYPGIKMDEWNQVGKAKVWYVEPGNFSDELILSLAKDKDLIYLSSFYDDYGYKTLRLRKKGRITCPVALASMGVFAKEALGQKSLKKKLFITACKAAGLFKDITWTVTSELEAADVKKAIGSDIRYVIAEDLPRSITPKCAERSYAPLRIVFLSRICAHKNLNLAINAVKAMDYKNKTLDIYGPIQEPDYWEECQKALADADFTWRYGGDIDADDVLKTFSEHDLMILPTKSENYGHVIFEALSTGCVPIISDRTPWQSVKEYGAGYVLPLDTKDFTKALDAFASLSVDEKKQMSASAVKLAQDKIDQSKAHTGYRAIFG